MGKPDSETRCKILRTQLDGRPHSVGNDTVREVAMRTEGATDADLELLVRDSTKEALLAGRDESLDEDLLSSLE